MILDGYYGKIQKEIEGILKTGTPILTFCFPTPFLKQWRIK
jgi:hypothetical protein